SWPMHLHVITAPSWAFAKNAGTPPHDAGRAVGMANRHEPTTKVVKVVKMVDETNADHLAVDGYPRVRPCVQHPGRYPPAAPLGYPDARTARRIVTAESVVLIEVSLQWR